MTRICMYCKRAYGEKCPTCGALSTREQLATFRCDNADCDLIFFEGSGGETHGVCPECRAMHMNQCRVEIGRAIADQCPGNWGALLGEMDQRDELHRLEHLEATA